MAEIKVGVFSFMVATKNKVAFVVIRLVEKISLVVYRFALISTLVGVKNVSPCVIVKRDLLNGSRSTFVLARMILFVIDGTNGITVAIGNQDCPI